MNSDKILLKLMHDFDEYLFFYLHKQKTVLQSVSMHWWRFLKVLSTWNFEYAFQPELNLLKTIFLSLFEMSLMFTHVFCLSQADFLAID